jgi:hypothetical protein
MTDAEQIEALRREVELLRGRIEEIAARANAEPRDEDPDADDFGGGGVPDEGGHVGRPPEGFVENFAVPVPTDTQTAEDPNALQYKSVDEREADQTSEAALQVHDFDEAPLSNTRRIRLKSVTTTGTGGGKKLQLVDPDGNADFQTKWMVPLREAGTGGREIKWACIGGEVDGEADVKTDTAVADESAANTQNRSVEERAGDDALQIRGFDEQSPGGSPLRKIELKVVTTTGTGGGTFLVLVDPDGNEVPGTKWTIPLREAGTGGGREIKWAAFGGKVDFSGGSSSVSTDTEQDPGNPPGESVEHYHATGETGGPLQIRGFQQDAAKALRYSGEGHTSGITLANAEVVIRDTTGRKRTEYVPASTFWLQGATAGQNFATGIKLGTAGKYITIDTTS